MLVLLLGSLITGSGRPQASVDGRKSISLRSQLVPGKHEAINHHPEIILALVRL